MNEETGIKKVEFLSKKILLKESYYFRNRSNERVKKKVDYFIAESGTKNVKIDKKEITNFRWCTLGTGSKLITFKESRKLLKKANKIISKH